MWWHARAVLPRLLHFTCTWISVRGQEWANWSHRYVTAGCSIRVQTLGKFGENPDYLGRIEVPSKKYRDRNRIHRGRIRVTLKNTEVKSNPPREDSDTLKKLPRQNCGLCYTLNVPIWNIDCNATFSHMINMNGKKKSAMDFKIELVLRIRTTLQSRIL